LISWWSLDETSGNRADSHGSNTLTDINTVLYDTGKVGNAAKFEVANSEYLSHVDNPALSAGDIDITWGCWVNIESFATSRAIISKLYGTNSEYVLYYHTNNDELALTIFSTTNGTVYATTLGSPSTATWYFVLGWHDHTANTINIQINNGTVDSVAHTYGIYDSNSDFSVGGWSGEDYYDMDGLVDEAFIYKRVLTADERTWLYNSGNGRGYSSVSGIPGIKTVNGVAMADIKTINGVAVADIKSIQGLT